MNVAGAAAGTKAALSSEQDIGVIGAGTMGAGIALVAARAGHRVRLHDAAPGAIERGLAALAATLDRDVARGRLSQSETEQLVKRIRVAPTIEDLAPSSLVIEAIVEDLAIKANVLRSVEAVVDSQAILATNTSSLSVTALGAMLQRPGQVVGMHFFNPAPVLPLVEVVSGRATHPEVASVVADTALSWGKTPVRCGSTPGFIVNRIARPFYGEALRLISEGAGDPVTLDAVMRECGGFRMGPFALMDLIGHDVNFAVTRSVYEATFGDARYRPSLVQRDLVDAGWLGRKSGRGFFDYRDGAVAPSPVTADAAPRPRQVLVPASLGPAASLVGLIRQAGFEIGTGTEERSLVVDGVPVALTDGRSATSRAARSSMPCAVFDLALDYASASRIAIAVSDGAPPSVRQAASGLFQALGKAVSVIDDAPGLVVARTVGMLANEAADALQGGLASAGDIDLSMIKGVNYPRGPVAWADAVGLDWVAELIGNLAQEYGEDRYRVSPLLRRRALAGMSLGDDRNP